MTPTDCLKNAKIKEIRRQKIEWLSLYFKSKNIKKTFNTRIEYIGFTDEQIDLEIEEYLEREMVLEGGL